MANEIKELLSSGKLIMGSEKTIKALRKGTLAKIFVATNVKEEIKHDIEHWAKLSDIEVINVGVTNDELGTMCKKPFAISVIGVSTE